MSAAPKTNTKQTEPKPTREAFDAVVKLANAGDRDAIARLAKMLDDHPDLWQRVGDLARHSEMLLILRIAGDDLLTRESVERQVAKMRVELCDKNATPMERLLIDNYIIAWLFQQSINIVYPTMADLSITSGRYVLQQRESAQRLLNAAQQALHTYRKFAPPKLKLQLEPRKNTVPFPTAADAAKPTKGSTP